MKISHKLVLSFLFVASLAGVTTYLTLNSYREINGAFVRLIDKPTAMIEALNDLKQSGMHVASSTREYGFIQAEHENMEGSNTSREEIQLISAGREALETSLEKYEFLVVMNAPGDHASSEKIRGLCASLIKTSSELVDLERRKIKGKQVLEKKEEFKSYETDFLSSIDVALKAESDKQIGGEQNVRDSIASAAKQTSAITALTFLLAIFSGIHISFLISRRLKKLNDATQRVGRGELDTHIEIDARDEIDEVALGFNKMTADLRKSRSELAAAQIFTDKVLESMVDFVVVTDLDLRITQINGAALRLNGYQEYELLGQSVNILMADRPFNKKGVDTLRKNGFAANLDKINLNKDGTLTPISMSLSVFKDERGDDIGIVCVGKDISERKRAEAEREVISEIIQGVTSTANLDELLALIHRSIGKVLSAENCFVALYDPKTEMLEMQFWVDKCDNAPPPFKMGKGFAAYVCRTERAVLMTPEIIEDLLKQGEIELQGSAPAIWLGVPLRTSAGIIGVLALQSYEDQTAFNTRDLDLLVSVGDQIALAIERKRVAEALRISEAQHRLLFESNPQPAFVYDLETLAFLTVNQAAVDQYGYSRKEFFTSITVKDIHLAEDIPSFLERVAKVTPESDAIMAPSRHQKKNGNVMDVEITSHALLFGGKHAAIVLVNDVTERRRREEQSAVVSEVIQGVATTSNLDQLLELVHRSVGKMLYAENCYVALYDKTADILSVPFCIDKYDAVASPAKLGRGLTAYVLRKGQPMLITPDGIRKLIDSGEVDMVGTLPAIWLGVPLRTREGVIGVLVVQHYEDPDAYVQRDVGFLSSVGDQIALAIERKQAENALRENEERYRELFENANDVIYTLDLSGNYTSLNRAGERITGYSRAEAVHMSITDVISPDDISGVRERIVQNIHGAGLPHFELAIIAKDGRKVTLDISSRLILHEDTPVGIQGIGRDITERKQAEEQLKIFNEKLQQSNRELQDFAYVASHDLQEPLRKVQAFSDRLKTKYADRLEGDGLDYLERMRSAANRMQLLIQDLLIFSRVSTQAKPFAPVDLNAITREVLSDLEVKIEETGATIALENLPVLDADPMQMRQLMQNLVGNALKFRQNDTPTVINIYSKPVKANGNGFGKCCQVFVKDNGIGFDKKYTDKIFAVFQRLHGRAEFEGSGVGLAICRKIVERHNGNITAQSNLGEGATFAFTIPLKQNSKDLI